jgi:hypothetical protein
MGFLTQPLSFFAIGPTRSFAGISGYVTITENTNDSLEITQQPVQQGAMIADHAFKKPVTLSIQIQFANDSSLTNGFGLFGGSSLEDIYESLLALQQPIPPDVLTPFVVTTPKRVYNNMLLTSLGLTTDKKTENVLSISASFQEVIIVSVGATIVPRKRLKNAANNGGVQNVGKKSAFFSLAQGVGAAPQ